MSDSGDPPDDIFSFERSEIDELKTSLLSSLEGEDCDKAKSAPSSPQRRLPSGPLCDLWSVFPLGLSVSAPSSPLKTGVIPRTSSVKDIVHKFETLNTSDMGDPTAAGSEAAEKVGQLSCAKG